MAVYTHHSSRGVLCFADFDETFLAEAVFHEVYVFVDLLNIAGEVSEVAVDPIEGCRAKLGV